VYNKSELNLKNLVKARVAASRKVKCQYCPAEISLGNITKHEISCKHNPSVLPVVCPVCKTGRVNKGSLVCSRTCSNKKWKRRKVQDGSAWSYRTVCFHFHKKECVVCGESKVVEVHHLDEDKANNAPENLVPLCPTHHQYWHSKYRYEVEEIILKYIEYFKSRLV